MLATRRLLFVLALLAGFLPAALRAMRQDVRVLVPAYRSLLERFPDAVEVARPRLLGGLLPAPVLRQALAPNGTPLLLVDYPPYFDRPGNPYLGPEGREWLINHHHLNQMEVIHMQ
jgi:starch synthase